MRCAKVPLRLVPAVRMRRSCTCITLTAQGFWPAQRRRMRFLQRRWRARVHMGSRAAGSGAPARASRARRAAWLRRAAARHRQLAHAPVLRAGAGKMGAVVARFALSSLLARAGGATTRSGTATRVPCRCALAHCVMRYTSACIAARGAASPGQAISYCREACALVRPRMRCLGCGRPSASHDFPTNCYATSLHSPGRPGQSGPPLRRFVALSTSTACAGRCVRRCVRSRSRWCWTSTMRR